MSSYGNTLLMLSCSNCLALLTNPIQILHHAGTPLGNHRDGSVGMTLKLISILRLMNPRALIPATTALATLDPDGRKKGILAGANVVMPNLTPSVRRGEYEIYEGKASTGAESAEGLEELKQELKSMIFLISWQILWTIRKNTY